MSLWGRLLWLLAFTLGVWTVWQLPIAEIGQAFTALGATDIVLWFSLNALIIAVGTQRWWYLIRAIKAQVSWFRLLAVRQAGMAVSFITPGPQFGGEPLQVYWLCQATADAPGMSANKAALSLFLDRIYELLCNFSVLLLGIVLLMFSSLVGAANWPRLMLLLTSALVAIAALIYWLVRPAQPNRAQGLTGKLSQRIHALLEHWQRARSALAELLHSGKIELLRVLAVSAVGWVLLLGELWFLLHLVGLEPSFAGFILVLVAQRLALLLPVPGGIGTVEAAVFWSFQLLGWSDASALGFIALMRLRDVLVLALGLALMRAVQSHRHDSNDSCARLD